MTTSQQHAARRVSGADKAIGARIRLNRMAKKISQTDLGELLGVSFQQVQKYEKGVNRIGSGRIKEVATHLGVTTNDLLGMDDSETSTGDLDEVIAFLTKPQGFRLARLMMKMTAEQRRLLADFIENMIGD
jgi:transcriptional regulator with XRE-family HTH domain